MEKQNTRVNLSIYNLANVAPRVTSTLNIASEDVEAAYHAIIARVEKAGGRIVTSNLNRQKNDQTTSTVGFEVPASEANAIAAELKNAGEMMKLVVSENPDVNNVTSAKRGFTVQLLATAGVAPRETQAVQIAAAGVAEARERILNAATTAGARVIASQLNEADRQNMTATLDLELKREKLADFERSLGEAGDAVSRNVSRSNDTENTIDTKVRVQLTVVGADKVAPKETTSLGVEARDVDAAVKDMIAAAASAGRSCTGGTWATSAPTRPTRRRPAGLCVRVAPT